MVEELAVEAAGVLVEVAVTGEAALVVAVEREPVVVVVGKAAPGAAQVVLVAVLRAAPAIPAEVAVGVEPEGEPQARHTPTITTTR